MEIDYVPGVVQYIDCIWVPVIFRGEVYAGIVCLKCYRDHIDLFPQFTMRCDNESLTMIHAAYELADWLQDGING